MGTATAAAPTKAPPAYPWPDIAAFLDKLVAKIGTPVKVYSFEMNRKGAAELCVQDQDRPDHVDCYRYESGQMSDRIPVKFETYPSVEAIDFHVIDLAEIDFRMMPELLARGRVELKLPDGDLSRIELERGDSTGFLTYSDIPIWTLNIDTPRHDGRIEFDLRGKVLHAAKD
jgi:hypothetical protein